MKEWTILELSRYWPGAEPTKPGKNDDYWQDPWIRRLLGHLLFPLPSFPGMPPQFLEQVFRLSRQPQLPRCKRLELQLSMVRVLVDVKQPRQVHRTIHREHLPRIEVEIRAQPLDDLLVRFGFDLQPHRIALAAIVQLGSYRLEQASRLFFR